MHSCTSAFLAALTGSFVRLHLVLQQRVKPACGSVVGLVLQNQPTVLESLRVLAPHYG